MNALISVVVTTYNRPLALAACLNSLLAQHDQQFEIIVADDGSTTGTQHLIADFIKTSPIPIQHAFHADMGFRAGAIRNKAVAMSNGSYILFLDGDCVVLPNFISRHRRMAEPKYFVPGNRILLSESYTSLVLTHQIPLYQKSISFFIQQRLKGHLNRILPLLYIPFNFLRYQRPQNWQKAMTCNLGIWKQDFLCINGFDELFQGWGYEDSDLIIRLIHLGIKRKDGRFALPVLHLWHTQNDRSQHDANYNRLMGRLADTTVIYAQVGIEQYL
jgi:glycosyltransferase involved in cell wall biosynthesis